VRAKFLSIRISNVIDSYFFICRFRLLVWRPNNNKATSMAGYILRIISVIFDSKFQAFKDFNSI